MFDITFRSFDFASPSYAISIELRDLLLRVPLGLKFSADTLSEEWTSYHIGGFDEANHMLACLVLKPLSKREIKMRQVAVSPDFQGKGIGKKLVLFSEFYAIHKGYTEMTLNARSTVTPFYEKLGYVKIGDEFEEVSIPHYTMTKALVTT